MKRARYYTEQKTHCFKGHEFTPENTMIGKDKKSPSGFRRQCRICKNEARLAWNRERKVARILGIEAIQRKKKRKHCLRGHRLTKENTIQHAEGHRQCRTCKNASVRAWHKRQPKVKTPAKVYAASAPEPAFA